MVFVDEYMIRGRYKSSLSAHLLPESHDPADLGELHVFAEKLGLSRYVFRKWCKFPNYVLTEARYRHAIELGATICTSAEYAASFERYGGARVSGSRTTR